ncbi:YdcF family protein [Novosphingobium sp. BW1]|uniref:YdcF family protein n=1 Tax=Novosphingobium sp. BW1 TaxID=2592621 RepID=UPI0011DE9EA6|nr:YdcF family protein [Novosphingobium sp. BW1]TYC93277.1 YdcF family protein [Novosphingobium sp. BW1]
MAHLALALTCASALAGAAPFATVPAHAGTVRAGVVRDLLSERLSQRLFPLLGHSDAVIAAAREPSLGKVLAERAARRDSCAGDLVCLAYMQVWSEAEIATTARVLAAKLESDAPGVFDDGVAAQVRRELDGVNTIIRTYGLGARPVYHEIDGAGAIDARERDVRLQGADGMARVRRAGSAQDFDPSLEFAIALMDSSDRTDAIGYEPIAKGLNAPAMARARGFDWSAFAYPAMILTGIGPEVEGQPLSPVGKYHLRVAATRFAQGDIGFIVISGGRAHPRETRFAEAEEMRRALVDRYAIPPEAIVIEPYARHTTTNLRNATRRLAMLGAPLARTMLIVSNEDQSAYIESAGFTQRNTDELGYQPGRVGRRLSPTALEFTPSLRSLRVDPRDPLDP